MIVVARSDMDQIKSIRVGSEGKRYGGKEAGCIKESMSIMSQKR